MKEINEAKNLSLDDPKRTLIHREIIKKKKLLRSFYRDAYDKINSVISLDGPEKIVELGSGGGILKEFYTDVITSDIMEIDDLDLHFSALDMPFSESELDGIIMLNVLHHIPDVEKFFSEAERTLKKDGKIVMLEPASTLFSSFIYRNFHHEGFDTQAEWKFVSDGPLSSSNQALPWIVFKRDRKEFEEKFPSLEIVEYKDFGPLKYIISGGLSRRQLLPSFFLPIIDLMEFLLIPLNPFLGLFTFIVIKKR